MQNHSNEWSTHEVDRRQAINYWNQLITEKVIGLDISSDQPAGFGGRLSGVSVDQQQAYLISAEHNQRASHQVSRYSTHPAHEIYILVHMRSGEFMLETPSLQTQLQVGDAVLLSATEAFKFCCPTNTSSLVLRFEQAWLKKWLPLADDCLGQYINGSVGWGRTLSSALWNINPADFTESSNPPREILDQVAGLLNLALVPRNVTKRADAIVHRITHCLRNRFDDPTLAPADVAAEIGISKRYLHQLLANSGTTFSQKVLEIRLDHACKLLQNPNNKVLSIAQIAYQCGFRDPGYFTRVFKKYLHRSPRDYRRL